MLNKTKIFSLLMVISLVFLTACGGGGGSSLPAAVTQPLTKLSGNLFQSGSLASPRRVVKVTDTVTGKFVLGAIEKDITIDNTGLFTVDLYATDFAKLLAANGIDISGDAILGKDFSDSSFQGFSAKDIIDNYGVKLKFNINNDTAEVVLPPSVLGSGKTTVLPKVVLKKEAGKFKYMVQDAEGLPLISNGGDFLDELDTNTYETILSTLTTVEKATFTDLQTDGIITDTNTIISKITPELNAVVFDNISNKMFFYMDTKENISVIKLEPSLTSPTSVCNYIETFYNDITTSKVEYTIYGSMEVSADGKLSKIISNVKEVSTDTTTEWSAFQTSNPTIASDMKTFANKEFYSSDTGIYTYTSTTGETDTWRELVIETASSLESGGFYAPDKYFLYNDGTYFKTLDNDLNGTTDLVDSNVVSIENGAFKQIVDDTGSGTPGAGYRGYGITYRFKPLITNSTNFEIFHVDYASNDLYTSSKKTTFSIVEPITAPTTNPFAGKKYAAIVPGTNSNYYLFDFKTATTVDILKYDESSTTSASAQTYALTENVIDFGTLATLPILDNAYILLMDTNAATATYGAEFTGVFSSSSTKKYIFLTEVLDFETTDYTTTTKWKITSKTADLLGHVDFATANYDTTSTAGAITVDNSSTDGTKYVYYKFGVNDNNDGFYGLRVKYNSGSLSEIIPVNFEEVSTVDVPVADHFYKTSSTCDGSTSTWNFTDFYNFTKTNSTTGTYSYTRFTPNAKTTSSGTYTISAVEPTTERYTVTFTASSGTAPVDMRIDYSDMDSLAYAFEDLADNTDTTANEGRDCWIVDKITNFNNLKFADTGSTDRAIIDVPNNFYYLWEQPVGGQEVYSPATAFTVADIPGGHKITVPSTGDESYVFSEGHFGLGDPGGPIVNYDASTQKYDYDRYWWDKGLTLSTYGLFADGTYCAFFKDPRTATGTPTWDELHIMTFSGSTITDLKYDSADMSTIEEGSMTWTTVDDTMLQITAGEMNINGLLTSADSTDGVYDFKMAPSNATFYEIVAITDTDVSGKTFDLTITQENGSGITNTIPGLAFASDGSFTGSVNGTWTIENGLLKTTDTSDNTVSYMYKLKNPLSDSTLTGFNFFIRSIDGADSSETIERGTAVQQ